MSIFNLTSRELEIIEKLVNGWSNKRIAVTLKIEPNTVRVHLQNIYQKMDVHSRFEVIVKYYEIKVITGYEPLY